MVVCMREINLKCLLFLTHFPNVVYGGFSETEFALCLLYVEWKHQIMRAYNNIITFISFLYDRYTASHHYCVMNCFRFISVKMQSLVATHSLTCSFTQFFTCFVQYTFYCVHTRHFFCMRAKDISFVYN